MFKRILLAYDLNLQIDFFIYELEKLTSMDKTKITLFHVISQKELEQSVRYKGIHLEELIENKKKNLNTLVSILEKNGFECDLKIGRGDIIKEIIKESNNDTYDLIILGNKKANSEIKNILGSVTHKISKISTLPILIIKEK